MKKPSRVVLFSLLLMVMVLFGVVVAFLHSRDRLHTAVQREAAILEEIALDVVADAETVEGADRQASLEDALARLVGQGFVATPHYPDNAEQSVTAYTKTQQVGSDRIFSSISAHPDCGIGIRWIVFSGKVSAEGQHCIGDGRLAITTCTGA